jgi:hypothetical protein
MKNRLNYRVVERSATRYFAEITNDNGCIVGYECGRIITSPKHEIESDGMVMKFDAHELACGNWEFYRDRFDMLSPSKFDVYLKYLNAIEFDKTGKCAPKSRTRYFQNELKNALNSIMP